MDYSKDAIDSQRKKHKSKSKKAKHSVGIIIMRIFTVIVIIAMFAVTGAACGVYMGVIESSPKLDLLAVQPDAYTSIIYEDKTGIELDRLHGDENREYVKLRRIPKHLQNAIVAIEDERFYTHNGIDFKGMLRALYANVKSRSFSEGASTITQQLLKNNIFKDNSKKIKRKLQEQYLAVKFEKQYAERLGGKPKAKEYILELYLNTIGLNHGLNGVQAAAMRYFNKDVSELSLAESAVIAAITKNPVKFTPINHPETNRERQLTILDKMLELGMISKEEHVEAVNEDVYSKVKAVMEVKAEEESHHTFFIDQIISDIAEDLQVKKSMSSAQAYNLIYSGGLKIYATIDTQMQAIVDESYRDDSLFPPQSYRIKIVYYLSVENNVTKEQSHYSRETIVKSEDEIDIFISTVQDELVTEDVSIVSESIHKIPQPQSAMVIMDFATGQVKAIAGARGEKLGDRTFNRATQAKRQPGSAFKVLAAYAPALDLGKITAATAIMDDYYEVKEFKYVPKNYYSGYLGLNTIRTGIRRSMNILAVKTIMQYTSLDTAFDYLRNFGFTTLIEGETRGGSFYTDKVPALALGGITDGVTPLELTAAYAAIANAGQYNKPIFYTKVIDHNGDVLLENNEEPQTVLQKTTAFILTDMLKDVVTGGYGATGGLAKFKELSMPIAGKTGTTSDDFDLVFAGYTPYYAAGIWLGNDKPSKLTYDKSYHLLLWSDIMEKIHIAQNLPTKDFEMPDGVVSRTVCMASGKLPISGVCQYDVQGNSIITEYFVQGTEPNEVCNVHETARICSASNMLATQYCPSELVKSSVHKRGSQIRVTGEENGSEDVVYVGSEYCYIHGPNTVVSPTEEESDDLIIGDDVPSDEIQQVFPTDQLPIIDEIDDGVSDLPLIIDSFPLP